MLYTFFIRNNLSSLNLDVSACFVKSSLQYFINLKTFTDNNNPDGAIVMQEKGFSGVVRHAMGVHSILLV